MDTDKTVHLTPMEYAIYAFRGVRPMARHLRVDAGQLSRLRRKRDRHGHLGLIPATIQRRILDRVTDGAVPLRVPLTPEHLTSGGTVVIERAAPGGR